MKRDAPVNLLAMEECDKLPKDFGLVKGGSEKRERRGHYPSNSPEPLSSEQAQPRSCTAGFLMGRAFFRCSSIW